MKNIAILNLILTALLISGIFTILFMKPAQIPQNDNGKLYYKLYMYDDSITVMDGERYVGAIKYDSSDISEMLLKDNE